MERCSVKEIQHIWATDFIKQQKSHTIQSRAIEKAIDPENSENLLRPTKLTLNENNQVMKKLKLLQKSINIQMRMTEDENIDKYVVQSMHHTPNTYEYDFICISCGYNFTKRKTVLTKRERKKNLSIQ